MNDEYVIYYPKHSNENRHLTKGERYKFDTMILSDEIKMLVRVFCDENEVSTITIDAMDFLTIDEYRTMTIENIINHG